MASRLGSKLTGGKKTKPVPVKIVSDYPVAVSDDMKWRARDDLRTLQQAAEIQRDKARLRAAKSEAKAQVKALSTVCK